jgi:hypothetical protein
MPTEPEPVTVAQIVHRAAQVCDPEGVNDGVSDLLVRFEDDDEPVVGAIAFERRLDEAVGAVDPQAEDPAVIMAAAVIRYLAHRRDELDDTREDILRLAARAELDATPPAAVSEWMAAQGVSV